MDIIDDNYVITTPLNFPFFLKCRQLRRRSNDVGQLLSFLFLSGRRLVIKCVPCISGDIVGSCSYSDNF